MFTFTIVMKVKLLIVFSKWKRINRKQSARWQHLSWLKASASFSLQKNLVSCVKWTTYTRD
jgi:hypothetical protein